MAGTSSHKVIIGRAELIHFNDFEIADLPAKVDTGAYRSAVHVSRVKLSEDGKKLSFRLMGGHPVFGNLAKKVTVTDFNRVSITNSFGHREERYEVQLKVKVGNKSFKSTFSLANREKMIYPVLLGRKMLNRRFLVDSAQTGVDRAALKRKYNIEIPEEEEQRYEDSDTFKRPR